MYRSSNSYIMCFRLYDPRALASGLSYVQVGGQTGGGNIVERDVNLQ